MSLELLFALFFPSYASYSNSVSQNKSYASVVYEELPPENTEYCQTVYWYPNALELMNDAWCDLESTEREIKKAKRG